MTNVLITGGAGYIGSKLATKLVNLFYPIFKIIRIKDKKKYIGNVV